MQTQRQAWRSFQQYNVVSIVVSFYLIVIAVCALYYTGAVPRANVKGVYAKAFTPCSKNDEVPVVAGGDTLVHGVAYYGLREQMVAKHDYFVDSVPLSIGQRCIQGTLSSSSNAHMLRAPARVTTQMRLVKPVAVVKLAHRRDNPAKLVAQAGRVNPREPFASAGSTGYTGPAGYAFRRSVAVSSGFVNVFSYGQCTWWAAQRYYQLHNIAVPWISGANAGQWTARAYESGWHVSSIAIIGSILVLQGGVQGAGAVGHVGIVEKVLNNGTAIASSMNWGYHSKSVSFTVFRPGPGVTFVER